MSEKDLEQQKKEAAERAKEMARQKLAEKQAATKSDQPEVDEKELAKKKAAAAAKAKAAALAKQKAAENSGANNDDSAQSDSEDAKELAKKKAAAAAKAKAAALAKQKASQTSEETAEGDDEAAKAKAKAAAAAKAKAAALAKQKASQASEGSVEGDDDLAKAKAKAVAAAKAKAAAAAKAKAAASAKTSDDSDASEDDLAKAKAKAIAAAKAKAAAAAKAKAAKTGGEDEVQEEKAPSPNQKYLDKYEKVIKEHLGEDVLADSYINSLSKDVPTLVAKTDSYFKIAEFLKYNEQLGFDYVSELHGTDYETHMEVYVHLYSYKNRQSVALKVKIDREQPVIDSIQPLWEGANWPEREAFDLLGIKFNNHPNLTRIMLPDDWVGYPLRKDYEPYDVEV
ncbi:NADH-quinone oxidoreductase subunit C [Bacillus timonensis]|nr:NADH-quinone oxidoreductase subunit C [Bacillus timonensis]